MAVCNCGIVASVTSNRGGSAQACEVYTTPTACIATAHNSARKTCRGRNRASIPIGLLPALLSMIGLPPHELQRSVCCCRQDSLHHPKAADYPDCVSDIRYTQQDISPLRNHCGSLFCGGEAMVPVPLPRDVHQAVRLLEDHPEAEHTSIALAKACGVSPR